MTGHIIQVTIEIQEKSAQYDSVAVQGTRKNLDGSTQATTRGRLVPRVEYTEGRWGRWYHAHRTAGDFVNQVVNALT